MTNDNKSTFHFQLKGRDAILYHALIRTGFLSVTFHHVLFEHHPQRDEFEDIVADDEILTKELRAILPRKALPIEWETDDDSPSIREIIIACRGRTPRALGIPEVTRSSTKFVRVDYPFYGNEVAIGTQYGTVCMVATRKGLNVDEPWSNPGNDPWT